MNRILVFGSLNIDYVYSVDHVVVPGETESSTARNVVMGGKGLNQAIAISRAGSQVFMAGRVGEDGTALLEVCKNAGINMQFVEVSAGPSGHTVIQVDRNAQNSILLYGGANMKQRREHIEKTLDQFGSGDILLLQNEINELAYLIEKAAKRDMRIVLNPSPFNDRLKECNLQNVSCFILNEIEGAQFTGETEEDEILSKMRMQFPEAEIVLTLGSAGAWLLNENEKIFQESFPVQAVDTTAAGDTFTGYYLAGIAEGLSRKCAMNLAAKAASLACTVSGAIPSIPVREEVCRCSTC